MTGRLVAIDRTGGPEFVTDLQRLWDAGDAALPIDQRLPAPARAALLASMAPAAVIDATGTETTLDGGQPVEPGDALVVATSGSTGEPKGAVLTHTAVAASAAATNERLGVTSADHWLACLPLAHVGGLSVVTRALYGGQRLTIHPGFDPAAVDASDATLVSLVATALARVDVARFRVVVIGGSTPPADPPANVVTTYGMTETGSGIAYDGTPLDGVEVRLDADGQIHVRGPMLLRTYRDGTAALTDGWFATGDVGRWLPDGRLHVDGRAGDVIVTGGEKVWPEPVEAIVRTVPGVADVAVAGRPDPEWGHAVTAFVVPAAGGPPPLATVRAAVKEHLPPWCAPRAVVVVAAIPRTATGKPRRHAL